MDDISAGDPTRTTPIVSGKRPGPGLRGVGLPRSLDEVRTRDVVVVIALALTIWGHVDVTRRGRIDPDCVEIHRTDFTVFTEAGAAFFDGRDPYRVTNPRGWYYLYPPLFALLVSPLSALDGPAQVGVWYALSALAAFGGFVESRRLWRLVVAADPAPLPGGARLACWIGGCAGLAVLLPTLDCLQRGQVGIVLIYLLLLGSRLVLQGGSWRSAFLGGVVLALPVVIKLIPLLPVAFLVLQRWARVVPRGRDPRAASNALASTAGVGAGVFLFLLAIPALCLGWGKNLEHLETWRGRVVANQNVDHVAGFNIHSVTNQGLVNAAHLLALEVSGAKLQGVPAGRLAQVLAVRERVERIVKSATWLGRASVLALLLATALGAARRDVLGQASAFGLACAAILVVSPLAWTHYFMFNLPALVCLPLWIARRGGLGAAKAAALVPVLLAWGHYAAMKWTGPIGLLGLGTALWVLVVGARLALGAARARRSSLRPKTRAQNRATSFDRSSPRRPRTLKTTVSSASPSSTEGINRDR